jgi:6-pyruvoyltetrahydropterin/6-carboxytetrahydropterin synthase
MKISKEFRWEMGHRLPNHKGLCKNMHGHSYRMNVEITGEILKNGMIIDFYDLGKIVKPILEKLDHSFMVWEGDEKIVKFLKENKMKMFMVPYIATVENICNDIILRISKLIKIKKSDNISSLTVKIFETPNSYAEQTIFIKN